MARDKATVQRELTQTRERLTLYLEREATMLKDGVQLYTIGSRSLQRYNTPLSEIRAEIANLRKRVAELEDELAGHRPRRAVAAVPHEW